METLVSSWSNGQSLPENYVFPPEERPGKFIHPPCKAVPVIDLGKSADHGHRDDIVQQILKASQEFGFFQVINHGVAGDLTDAVMSLAKEFFDMPIEDRAGFYSDDTNKSTRLYTSSFGYAKEKVHYWRDSLRHPCHPVNDWMQFWPEKPVGYREVVGRYSVQVEKLGLRILDLICEGLGLELGYFGGELTKSQTFLVNHYPPCPDPSLTLGVPKHSDPNLINILLQGDVHGLQVFKDGQWVGVEPLPNSFVVNVGLQLQVISNGKLASVMHRAVTNAANARTSIVTVIAPSDDCVVEPAKALVSSCNPPVYKAFKYNDFHSTYIAKAGDPEATLESYRFQA
ncbi:hyoscyamine 6-dioxygenase-like [Malania oleifera]|uniref:hyoscyamine 6-dioxygenase-like n=1 Tax=Malania oleifera TaxID=397392 RepID=UPI0025ADF2A9|nr:hyoscyamine 6-dioxygenase-like [Malania oleifera]